MNTHMPLDRALFHQIVEFLLPYLSDVTRRRALVFPVFMHVALVNHLTWKGTPYDFTVHLVKSLDQWGEIDDAQAPM